MLIKQRACTQIARALMPSTVGIGGAIIDWHARPAMAEVPETDGPDSGPLKRPNASVAVKERSAAGQQPNSSAERADHNPYPNGSRVRLRRFDSWSHCSEKQYLHLASPAGGSVLLILYLPPAAKYQPHLVFQS